MTYRSDTAIFSAGSEVPNREVEKESQVTRIRLETVLAAKDSSHAVLVGTTDDGTVRVSATCSIELGMVLALAADAAGPLGLEVPEDAIFERSEIDPSAG